MSAATRSEDSTIRHVPTRTGSIWCRRYAIAEERDFVDQAVSALTVAPSHGRPPVSQSYGASARA